MTSIDNTSNPYPLPHNSSEKSRLDAQHASYKYHLGTNVVAPLSPDSDLTGEIIDVGTGSGVWALEVAKEFPRARVTGIDLAYPVFEDGELPPENSAFLVSDVTNGIEFPDGSVDLVHSRCDVSFPRIESRLVQLGIKKDQWPGYFSEVFRVLKPGIGWIQITEPISDLLRAATGNVPPDSAYREVLPFGEEN
jgi:ubiquinone/menaquinone biosynthesis C-methylase UbiE